MGSVNGYHHLSHETNGTDGMGSVNGYHHLSHETNGTDGRYHSDGMHDKNTSPGPPEAIAIVGLSCRFPGDATSPDKFWDMCAEGRSAWTPIPEERFNAKAFYHPQGEKQYTVCTRGVCR
jgi:hypothetical protein